MAFLPFPLYTDVLLWLLMAVLVAYGWYCSRRAHLAAPWKRVLQSKAAVVSAVVLACYVLVGLADSLHYRPRLQGAGSASAGPVYSLEVLSVLDLALSHLRERRERTYSAPLATRLYAKEQVQVDGKTVRDFPRLRYGGAHLKDEADLPRDVAVRIGLGLACAAVLGVLVALGVRRLNRRNPEVPWGAAGATLLVVLAIALPVAFLAQHYHVLGTDKVGQDVLYQALK
jgi:peptide/nickel transport system permease protein